MVASLRAGFPEPFCSSDLKPSCKHYPCMCACSLLHVESGPSGLLQLVWSPEPQVQASNQPRKSHSSFLSTLLTSRLLFSPTESVLGLDREHSSQRKRFQISLAWNFLEAPGTQESTPARSLTANGSQGFADFPCKVNQAGFKSRKVNPAGASNFSIPN